MIPDSNGFSDAFETQLAFTINDRETAEKIHK